MGFYVMLCHVDGNEVMMNCVDENIHMYCTMIHNDENG